MNSPIYIEVNYQDPLLCLSSFDDDQCVLLESVTGQHGLGRYSYLAVSPFDIIEFDGESIKQGNKVTFKKDIFSSNLFF